MGHKGTPFPHLQFMAQSVPPPQIVIMLGKGTRPLPGGSNLNVAFPTSHFALQPLPVLASVLKFHPHTLQCTMTSTHLCAFLCLFSFKRRNAQRSKSAVRALSDSTSGIARNENWTRIGNRNARRFQSCRWTGMMGFLPP